MSSPDADAAAGGAPRREVPCAGGLVYDPGGRLLLIRRANPPARGRWSVPGGRVEPGETAAQACVREVAEETGLRVTVDRLAGRVLREGADGSGGIPGEVFVIDDFVCTATGGQLHAATDALEARWVDAAGFAALAAGGELADLLAEALTGWDALPRS